MNDEQKTVVGNVVAEHLGDATPIQIANFILLTKTQQNNMIAGWVTDKKTAAQTAYDGADGVAADIQADATAEIALYDSILALV